MIIEFELGCLNFQKLQDDKRLPVTERSNSLKGQVLAAKGAQKTKVSEEYLCVQLP